ncbi:type II toxin-antitoxin system VapC family toxin [Candidatus Bathyarchaeota archaeon]|nr:MAG: type II toxin-antitoxin system VapC family toxin [Candidatus Bathyarchaeota archaeon]
MRLFIDTGPLSAFYNKRDRDHPSAVETFRKIAKRDTAYGSLYTSDYVMDEAVTLLRARTRNHKLSVQLGTDILTSKTIILLKTDDEALMGSWGLYKQRSDVALSFTDSTIAFLAKKHFISDIFSYDAHFGALGFHVLNRL